MASAIDMDSFADLYGEAAIQKDKEYLRTLGPRPTDASPESFRTLVKERIEHNDWLGPGENLNVMVPSRFDEIVNGVDLVIEFDEEGAVSHLALAMNATKNEDKVKKKLDRIKASIDKDELTKVKYFHSKNFRGELSGIPRVVVGADSATVEDISTLLRRAALLQKDILENKRPEDAREFTEIRNEIATHPLQRMILIEIKEQLEAFRAYAESLGRSDTMGEYSKVLHLVGAIVVEKQISGETISGQDLSEDAIFKMILEGARSFNKAK
jgi:hypothetical protein